MIPISRAGKGPEKGLRKDCAERFSRFSWVYLESINLWKHYSINTQVCNMCVFVKYRLDINACCDMFLFGKRLFFDADRRRGMSLRHLLHSLLLSEPWRVSFLCSAVCLWLPKTMLSALLDQPVFLMSKAWCLRYKLGLKKKEDISTTRTGTYLCRLKTRLQVQNPTIEK